MPINSDYHSEPVALLARDRSGTEGAASTYTELLTTRAVQIESLGAEELSVFSADVVQEGYSMSIRLTPRVRAIWDQVDAVTFRSGQYEVQSRSGEYPAIDRTLTVSRRIGSRT